MQTENNTNLPSIHRDLQEEYTRYEMFIDKGAFGKVYLIRHKDGTPYAIKEVELDGLDPKTHLDAIQEALNLKELKHNNIISFKDIQEIDNKLLIIMEYAEGRFTFFI